MTPDTPPGFHTALAVGACIVLAVAMLIAGLVRAVWVGHGG